MATASKLPVDTDASALDMAGAMFGNGIKIVSADYSGASTASGIYSDGDKTAPDLTPADSGVILSTGKADDVTNASGDANVSSGTSTNHGLKGDADLDAVSGQQTFDAAVFNASFVPEGSTLTMQVVFSSEEYLEYTNSGFNDAVGVWVNGQPAELTVGSGDITINNINDDNNANLYIDNPASAETYNTEMDGFTVTLTLKAPVVPDQVNTIKIAIADGGDAAFDSNLLIAGNSVQTALIAQDDAVELAAGGSAKADLLANDSSSEGGTLTITHVNGQPVTVGDTVTLTTGQQVTLTAEGVVLTAGGDDAGSGTFSYTVADAQGNTDTAFVDVTTTPACFTAGTLIDTPGGPVPVEALQPGDRVLTRDHGAQVLRWAGRTVRRALGRDAPVEFAAGALGAHAALSVSPCHRVLMAGVWAELLFGTDEVLVKARDLVNGASIRRRCDGAPVTYVHLLFDRHEVILGNGLPSESYHPGRETAHSFDADSRAELLRLWPELAGRGAMRYGPAARRSLRRHEARVLAARAFSRAAAR